MPVCKNMMMSDSERGTSPSSQARLSPSECLVKSLQVCRIIFFLFLITAVPIGRAKVSSLGMTLKVMKSNRHSFVSGHHHDIIMCDVRLYDESSWLSVGLLGGAGSTGRGWLGGESIACRLSVLALACHRRLCSGRLAWMPFSSDAG